MKIVHLEDHVLFADGFRAIIKEFRSEVEILSASDAALAFQILKDQPDVDLLIVDLTMPGLDGNTFIDGLNQRNLYIPVLVLSATEDLERIKAVLSSGASGFMPKTASIHSILTTIDKIMQGETVVAEDLLTKIDNLDTGCDRYQQDAIQRYRLTKRQVDVLNLLRQGCSNKEIATVLDVSIHTVKIHVNTLCDSFSANNRTECVFIAEHAGIFK